MIIGVLGLIGSGKGTVGDILVESHGFVSESFAKPLKDAAAVIFNWPRNLLEGNTTEGRAWREKVDPFWSVVLKKPNFTPRLALQWMGTESGRNVFGEELWTSALFNRVDPSKDYIITDVRFVNEADSIRQNGGKLILVERGEKPDWWQVAQGVKQLEKSGHFTQEFNYLDEVVSTAPHIHRSEWDWCLTDPDAIINNCGTLDELKTLVSYVHKDLKFKSYRF